MAAVQAPAAVSGRQPPWKPPPEAPTDANLPPLAVWNSLTRSKTPFTPLDWKNRTVSIYACGVTPYDDAHLGHIRNYTTLDIVVRILRDFFKFKIHFVMNVTDVDDKIILRARQRHLLERYQAGQLEIDGKTASSDSLSVGRKALGQYVQKNLGSTAQSDELSDLFDVISKRYELIMTDPIATSSTDVERQAKHRMHAKTAHGASKALEAISRGAVSTAGESNDLNDVLMPYLDSKASIDASDYSIFSKVSRKYEERFWKDLRSMNCLPVSEVTRVTEYIPQIVDFIKKIQENGFAYATSDGSVYFDIESFEAANNKYPRLEPWSRNDTGLQADGEGALSTKTTEKRNNSDFALWKSSKAGEPSWSSPWGRGRPGWHIECSAMASDRLGSQFDIHSGGIDLAFPHHDNELAQSEAYWTNHESTQQHQWVNYFLHIGHLSIAGAKMSKSLKNFTTIRDALARGEWTPRGLRIIFLLGGWRDGIEIKEGLIKEGSAWEDKANNFFIKVKDIAQNSAPINGAVNGTSIDPLIEQLRQAEAETLKALCDSFNTAKVMDIIQDLIGTVNASEDPNLQSVLEVARWITSMVNIFGLNGDAGPEAIEIGWSGLDIPAASKDLVSALSDLRDHARSQARSSKGLDKQQLELLSEDPKYNPDAYKEAPGEIRAIFSDFKNDMTSLDSSDNLTKAVLQLCDKLRDVDLWNQDIYLEDREGNRPALIRPVTRELRAAREEKEERDRQKLQAKLEREREAAAKADKGRQSHLEMFKTTEYSSWDEEGIPTKDAKGEDIPKSRGKKLKKDWERQKKLHEAWVKTNS